MTQPTTTKLISLVTCLFLISLLAGCATGNIPVPVAASNGRVQGAKQDISGATIQLFAVGNTGMASMATPLLSAAVKTDSKGGFSIAGLWNCSNVSAYGSDPLIYITASGGSAGGNAGTNSGLLLMSAIGHCSTFTPTSLVYINEVTTVSAAYALEPFMVDASHIGASTAFLPGLSNAFATASTLVNSATGTSPGANAGSGITVPSSEINSLANSVAPCVGMFSLNSCATLFTQTTPVNGSAPTNTLAALLNVVASPLRNVSSIFALGSGTSIFQPQLLAAPNDWTMALTFSGNGISGPQGIAIDASGGAWIANASGAGVTGLSNSGTALTGAAPYTAKNSIYGAQAVAVDRTGNIWVADTLLSNVVKLSIASGVITGAATLSNGFSGPSSIAIDGGNRVWVTNFGDGSVTALSNSGSSLTATPITSSALQAPAGIAVDGTGTVWVTDNSASAVFEIDKNLQALTPNGLSDGALIAPVGIAIDPAGRKLVADTGLAAVSLFAADGSPANGTPVSGAGLTFPTAVAIDGAGATWVTNNVANGSVTKLSTDASSNIGGLGALNSPAGEAIDSSGSLWVTSSGNNTVSKFIGLATPVITPLAANLPALP